jgi:purine-binding chemotaxis protein CheW
MPNFMKGVVNLRGSVVPILDLKLKFGIDKTEITNSTAIIVIEILLGNDNGTSSLLHLGIFADTVKKVVTLSKDNIEPPPKIGTKIKTTFILGISHLDDDFIVILDIREILSEEELATVDLAKDISGET